MDDLDRLLESAFEDVDPPTACRPGGPDCSWIIEQVGYEEKAQWYWTCETHGVQGRRATKEEVRRDQA